MVGHNRSPSGGGRPRKLSESGHTRNPSGGGGAGDAVTFEDKRKENFEAGRMELERRRKAIREQQEREVVSGGLGRGRVGGWMYRVRSALSGNSKRKKW